MSIAPANYRRGTLVALTVLAGTISSVADDTTQSETTVAKTPSENHPVILLTGFEPFGPGRPANPSWEGIKELDGRTWRGHKIVCRQLKVVWGEPLVKLRKWNDELHPVAIFSFGQGGGFTLETRARNARGSIPDNNGDQPPTPQVAADGPREFAASLPSKLLLSALKSKGYDVRASQDAGSYLCEETLYTLEYLKAAGDVPAVAFCHVPPLGAPKEEGPLKAFDVQQFVEDFLGAWLEEASGKPLLRQTALAQAEPQVSEQEREVRDLIDRYFRSWSSQDLVRYGQCFMPQAAIQLIDSSGKLITMPLAPFLKSQQEAQRNAANPMTETPESVDVRFEAELARVVVRWKLVDGQRVEYGYDHFTLMRSEGKWRIANLTFYADKPTERPAARSE
jgi:pyroglutamyl-peptidase